MLIVHVQQLWIFRLQFGEQRIESGEGAGTEISERRMKVDGVHGNDERQPAIETDSGDLQTFFDVRFALARFKVEGPINIENAELVPVWRFQSASCSALGYLNASFRPAFGSVAVGSVSGSARRNWRHAKQQCKVFASFAN